MNTSKRNLVCRLSLVLAMLLVLLSPLFPNSPATARDSQPLPLTQQVVSGPFDGRLLYQRAFEALRDQHYKLQDPAVRAKWAATWEHKHDFDGMLKTEQGADKAITEMKLSLGERFDYYNLPAVASEEQQQHDASLVGIGASVQLKGLAPILKALPRNATREEVEQATKVTADHPVIIAEEPEAGTPAAKAGLRVGDYITAVNGNSVDGKTLTQVVSEIRGKADTTVKVTVSRPDGQGSRADLTVEIRRAPVIAHAVKYKDLGNGIAYVRLSNFVSQFTEKEMKAALEQAAKGKGLILDLRHNPGGQLNYVESIAMMMMKEGPVLATRSRKGDDLVEQRYVLEPEFILGEMTVNGKDQTAKPMGRLEQIIPDDMPIVVLVNEGSASGSELLSGILQANHRAVVVGVPTVGKGVGQEVIQLPFNRNMHVTSFEFFPAGKAMNWVGVIPDIEVAQPEAFLDDPSNVANDTQLNVAQKTMGDLVSKQGENARKREESRHKHEQEFNEQLQLNPRG